MIYNKCFLYIDDYPVNARDIPFDVSIDWDDGSPTETHAGLTVTQVPQLHHVYPRLAMTREEWETRFPDEPWPPDSGGDVPDRDRFVIRVTLTNNCGTATREVEYVPVFPGPCDCENEYTLSAESIVTNFADESIYPDLSITGCLSDLEEQPDGTVVLRITTDAATSLPLVTFPEQMTELSADTFVLDPSLRVSESLVTRPRAHILGQVEPTLLEEPEIDLIYTLDPAEVTEVRLAGDEALTARINSAGGDPPLWTETAPGLFTTSIQVNRVVDTLRLSVAAGAQAELHSIVLVSPDGDSLVDRQQIGLKAAVLHGWVTFEDVLQYTPWTAATAPGAQQATASVYYGAGAVWHPFAVDVWTGMTDSHDDGWFDDYGSTTAALSTPRWIMLDLGPDNAKSIERYSLRPARKALSSPGGGYPEDALVNAPGAFILQGSNDASVWVDVDRQVGVSYRSHTAHVYFDLVERSEPYRYWRLYITAKAGAAPSTGRGIMSLGRFRLYVENSVLGPPEGLLCAGMSGDLTFTANETYTLGKVFIVGDSNLRARIHDEEMVWIENSMTEGPERWIGSRKLSPNFVTSSYSFAVSGADTQGTVIGDAHYSAVGFYEKVPPAPEDAPVVTTFAVSPELGVGAGTYYYMTEDAKYHCVMTEEFTFTRQGLTGLLVDNSLRVAVLLETVHGPMSASSIFGRLNTGCVSDWLEANPVGG